MKSFQKKLQVLAVAAALGAGVAGNVQAGVLAQSVLEITNFQFLNSFGGTTVNANQFDAFAFKDSSQATASMTTVPPTVPSVATGTINSNLFGTLDLAQQCVGNCIFGQNDFSHRSAPSTLNIARGDTLLTGSPILNPAGVSTPAFARTVAEAQLTTISGNGNVQDNLSLIASFSFSLANDQAVTVDMDTLSHLIAAVGVGNTGDATASETWVINLVTSGGTTVFSWSPDGVVGTGITGGTEHSDACNLNVTRAAQLPGQTAVYDCGGDAAATTGLLLAAETYTLDLRHTSLADVGLALAVPEPGTLLLLGLGLAGLGFGAIRRKKVAA